MNRKVILSILLSLVSVVVCATDGQRFVANRKSWEHLPSKTLLDMGNSFYADKNMPDSSFLCMSILVNRCQAQTSLSEDETKYYIVALNYLSNLYKIVYTDYYKAHTYILKAKELAEENYTDYLPYIYLTMGNLYLVESGMSLDKPNYDKVLDAYKHGFKASLASEQHKCISDLFVNIVQVALGEDMLPSIRQEIKQYAQFDIPQEDGIWTYAKNLCRGIQLWQGGNHDKALQVFYDLPATGQLQPDDLLTLVSYDITYHALIQLGREEEALHMLDTMIVWAKKYDQPECLTDAYRYCYEYYKGKNDHAQTDKYELLWRQQRDSTINRTHMSSFQKASFLFDMAKKNDQMSKMAHKKQMQLRILIIITVFSVFAIAIIVVLLINRRRIQQNYRQLYQKLDQLAVNEQRQSGVDIDIATDRKSVPAQKYSHNQIDDEVSAEILRQVMHIMETSEEIYDETFSIERLAEMMSTKKIYISQAINVGTGQPFSTLLNGFRIKEACRRMSDLGNYGHYSVEGIAQSVGYSSRSHFSKLFKNFTGLTPSAYQKMAKEGR